jgi:hypothetical protein
LDPVVVQNLLRLLSTTTKILLTFHP